MTRNCICGGTFKRTDVVQDLDATELYGRPMFRDTDPLVAHWRCDKCGSTREQKKRQPRVKP